ncbi:MAG TPA: hypothetical protein VH143_05295 [Kofleriaceae bacterium]|jgi:hypothetical protein|nr:hypothetical protein [Kofleriaceae bacterium]
MRLVWILALVAGCATSYSYRFDPVANGSASAFEDDAIKADLHVADDSLQLDLQNKTDQILQVEWNKISLDRGDGTTTRLHPASDLGWVEPGNTAVAQLVPVAFPQTGSAAAAYQGRTLELAVPMVVRHESKTYRFAVLVHVQAR